jgi:hypothetical protein
MKKLIFFFAFFILFGFGTRLYAQVPNISTYIGCLHDYGAASLTCIQCFTAQDGHQSCDAVTYTSPCTKCYDIVIGTGGQQWDVLTFTDNDGMIHNVNINKDWTTVAVNIDGRDGVTLNYTVFTE